MSKVPSLSIFFMGAAAFAGFLIPIVLFIYFRKNKKTDISPFFVGCFIFIFFSMILETSVHKVVLGSSIGANIKNNIVPIKSKKAVIIKANFEVKLKSLNFFFLIIKIEFIVTKPIPPKIIKNETVRVINLSYLKISKLLVNKENPALQNADIEWNKP